MATIIALNFKLEISEVIIIGRNFTFIFWNNSFYLSTHPLLSIVDLERNASIGFLYKKRLSVT